VSAIGLRRGYALSQVARLGRDRVIGREHRFGDVVATLCLPDLRHLQNRGLDFRSLVGETVDDSPPLFVLVRRRL
jgi:hypothetical protein